MGLVWTSAGPDLLDPLDPRTLVFHLLRICCKTIPPVIYDTDLLDPISSLFTLNSLCKVLDDKIYNSLVLNWQVTSK